MTAKMLPWDTYAIISPFSLAVQCGEACALDVCKCTSFWHKCETTLKWLRRSLSSSFTLFVSNCSLTWQTSPFKGTDGGAVEQLMICFSGLKWKKHLCVYIYIYIYIYYRLRGLSLQNRRGIQKTKQEGSCCHGYYIWDCFEFSVWVNIGAPPVRASVVSLSPKSVWLHDTNIQFNLTLEVLQGHFWLEVIFITVLLNIWANTQVTW